MWILIIFLYSSNGVAATSVPGFQSWKACDIAAKRVGQNMHVMTPTNTICVRATDS